jgi:hypothetical protein
MPLANPYTFRGPMGMQTTKRFTRSFCELGAPISTWKHPLVSPAFFNISSPMLSNQFCQR